MLGRFGSKTTGSRAAVWIASAVPALTLGACKSVPPAEPAANLATLVPSERAVSAASPAEQVLRFRAAAGEQSMRTVTRPRAGGGREIRREIFGPATGAGTPEVVDRVFIVTQPEFDGDDALVSVRVESQKAETRFASPLLQPGLDLFGVSEVKGQIAKGFTVSQSSDVAVLRDGVTEPLAGKAEQTITYIDTPPGAPAGSTAWRIELTIRVGPSVTRTRTERTIAPSAISPTGELWAETRRLTVHVLGVRIEKQEESWVRMP